jgi:adenosylmethionine-8-amino-7-oxononanoate aminotransferase
MVGVFLVPDSAYGGPGAYREVRVTDEASAADWVRRDEAVVWHGFTQMSTYATNSPIVVDRGEGRELIDVEGRRYLDAVSSIWMMTLGHRVPELDAALHEQVDRIAHSTMLGHGNVATVRLAEALAPRLPVDDAHLLFAADGAAAVEQALKIAFQFWTNQGVAGRTKYLAFGGAYHGDTIGSLAVGGGGFGTDIFEPLLFGTIRAPGFDDPSCIEVACDLIAAHAGELAAVIVEPLVQGAAGIEVRPASEFAALAEACRVHDVLLICDEVAVGFGRTGTLFASERCGIRPDIVTVGKGITGGYLPMSATAANRRVYDAFLGEDLGPKTLYHGHSYAGNALASAVALRHLELLDEWDVLANVEARAAEFVVALDERVGPLPQVKEIRQQGLMIGIELAPPAGGMRWGRRVSAASVEAGVLIRPLGDVVVVVPMLTTTADEVDRICDVVAASIRTAAT